MTAFNTNRIRFLCENMNLGNDQMTGNPPQFVANTDLQFEIGFNYQSLMLDASSFSTVTLAVLRPGAVDQQPPLMQGQATSASAGWNSNPAAAVNSDVIPSYATYSGSGSYTVGVQKGGVYTWTRGANDNALACNSVLISPSNLVASLTTPLYNTSGTPYKKTITGLLNINAFYQWIAGSSADTGIDSAGNTGTNGFFMATGTDVLFGSGTGTTPVTAQIYPATAGSNLVGQTIINYAAGTLTQTGSNLISGVSYVATAFGANLVPTGVDYTGGAYTMAGLTIGSTYYWTKGANDSGCAGLSASGYFVASGTTAAMTGTGTDTITATVTLCVAPFTYSLTGLTIGTTYVWTPGANDISCAGLISAGNFVATATSVTLTGTAAGSVTASVFATTSVGTYTLNGLTVGQVYYWTKAGNDTNLIYGATTITSSGFFIAPATSVVLSGTSGAVITALVQPITVVTQGTFVAGANTAVLTGTASATVDTQLSGSVSWALATDQHCIIPFSHTLTDLYVMQGGTATYQLQISAVMATTANQVVLGYGTITVLEDGFANGTPGTANLASGNYSGAGVSTISGLTVGATYYWVKGANDTNCVNGANTQTTTGPFTAAGTSVTLNGTISIAVTAIVYATK